MSEKRKEILREKQKRFREEIKDDSKGQKNYK
jgi:hypothetical protein